MSLKDIVVVFVSIAVIGGFCLWLGTQIIGYALKEPDYSLYRCGEYPWSTYSYCLETEPLKACAELKTWKTLGNMPAVCFAESNFKTINGLQKINPVGVSR